MKKLYEPLTKKIKDTSRDIAKTMMETSEEDSKELTNLNNKLSEIRNDKGIIAPNLMSPLSKIPNLKHTSQFERVKDPSSNRVSDLLINKAIPLTLHNNLLIFRDTNKRFKLQGDLSKMVTEKT